MEVNKHPEEYKFEELKQKQKSVFTKTPIKNFYRSEFNPFAEPFEPNQSRLILSTGTSQLPINAKVWPSIASTRPLPSQHLNPTQYIQIVRPPTQQENGFMKSTTSYNGVIALASDFNSCPPYDAYDRQGHNCPPAFDADPTRRCYFRREFGPVATCEGFLDIRLRKGINILLTLDHGILIENGTVRIAVSPSGKLSALDHPNGRIRQMNGFVDIVAYDGSKNNNYVRYGKIWKDGVSLTSQGFCLTYLVDMAGTRTTSDQVNRDWNKDYCKEIFYDGFKFRSQSEIDYAAANYNYKVGEDGSETFFIAGVKISQTRDGMVRAICSNHFSIRTSVENRSVTLNTPIVYSTASMSDSPHLFVRYNERRVHFDGANFIVRYMGHSSSFDANNNLRIH